ncbi:hypothetical protein IMZ48_47000 [Candidatus Bathyarchaeota archaeon]|nr:hypothetical protein [Candidatus Bathyarchaeota archaeon]
MNPFVPSGWIGTCQFPQITSGGLDDSWVHGRDLYGVYHNLLAFLPEKEGDWKDKVRYRVTNNEITSQVAGMVVNGMWGVTDSFPLSVQVRLICPPLSAPILNETGHRCRQSGAPIQLPRG